MSTHEEGCRKHGLTNHMMSHKPQDLALASADAPSNIRSMEFMEQE